MRWDESQHKRDAQGQFTFSSVGAWAKTAAERMGREGRVPDAAVARRGGDRPPGYEAAVRRLNELEVRNARKDPPLTAAERAERDELDDAMEEYRQLTGATGRGYDAFGRPVPAAKLAGMVRIGDHPTGAGRMGSPDASLLGQSDHPEAGGLWVRPEELDSYNRRIYNDATMPVGSMVRPKKRSQRHREDRWGRKYEDWSGTPQGRERAGSGEGGKIGYTYEGRPAEFLAWMLRERARGRMENARTPVRRTPRGTQVEGWMDQASAQMMRRAGRG